MTKSKTRWRKVGNWWTPMKWWRACHLQIVRKVLVYSIFSGLLWGKVCRKQTSKGLLPSFKLKIKGLFCQCSLQTIRHNDLDIKPGLVSEENGNMEKSDHKILPCWESIFTALFSKSGFLVFFRHSLRALSKIFSALDSRNQNRQWMHRYLSCM